MDLMDAESALLLTCLANVGDAREGGFPICWKKSKCPEIRYTFGGEGGGDAGFDLILNLHNLLLPLHFIFRTYIVYIYIRKYIIYPSIIHDP